MPHAKRIASSVFFVLLTLHSYAQEAPFLFKVEEGYGKIIKDKGFIVGVSAGYGRYNQSDLDKVNQLVKRSLNFKTEMTDNFPATPYFGFYLMFKLNRHVYAGPDYKFQTTGSRLAYMDYSGSYTFDQTLTNHSLAIRVEITPGKEKNLQFCFSTRAGINFAGWDINENLKVGEESESSAQRFDGISPFLNPMLKVKYRIIPAISIGASAGWSIDITGRYHTSGVKDAKTEYVPKWSGQRAELNLELIF